MGCIQSFGDIENMPEKSKAALLISIITRRIFFNLKFYVVLILDFLNTRFKADHIKILTFNYVIY